MSQLLRHHRPAREQPRTAIETDIPFRLDRLPWGRFHWLLVTALGVTWVLDGLEASIVGSLGPTLRKPAALGLDPSQIGVATTLYLSGCIGGALLFGHLTDRLGRKRLFTVTLGVYLLGAVLTAFSFDFWSFALFRIITGMAIGGEYSAINSAIDELIPARVRGRVDLIINGTYWIGVAAGAGVTVVLLDNRFLPDWLGWRLSFGLGGLVGLAMIFARHYVPESPRWLLIHGGQREADEIMAGIESHFTREDLPPVTKRLTLYPGGHVGFGTIARTLFVRYPGRAFLGLVLIASQAFLYNGISFTYPMVLTDFFGVDNRLVGAYMLPFAAANFLGPLVLGHFFDTVGRRPMISATYALTGVLIVIGQLLFLGGFLNATTQTLMWSGTFLFASAAASAGYLTVSEIFPLEMRALAIAVFYVIGTAVGGLVAPSLFGLLIQMERADMIALGYFVGAGLMLVAAVVELIFGVPAECKSLEEVTAPLSAEQP
jgi:MFS family permease